MDSLRVKAQVISPDVHSCGQCVETILLHGSPSFVHIIIQKPSAKLRTPMVTDFLGALLILPTKGSNRKCIKTGHIYLSRCPTAMLLVVVVVVFFCFFLF